MPLPAGTRLGPYEIVSPLGAGGMGEVYKARDTRLDRIVAIKVLSGHHSTNPQARERFEREARAISSLSNPHICSLYDVGQQDGIDYLVMEYLQGETLASRLTKGRLAHGQALQYAVQIADALATAHHQGLIHRDLKPGNIMLTKTGAKVLDFGLAKVRIMEANAAAVATQSMSLTSEGTILGTLQYMAPEQLEGKEADARSDIFSFGLVLYEMLTGKRAFEGSSPASLIAAIMESPAPSIATAAPAGLDRLLQRCLKKDPDDRWQCMRDLKAELEWIAAAPGEAAPVAVPRYRILPWAAAAVAIVVAFLIWIRGSSPAVVAPIDLTFSIPPPSGKVLGQVGELSIDKISPDGSKILLRVARRFYVRRLDSLESEILPAWNWGGAPFWAPDSQSIGFPVLTGTLMKMRIPNGAPELIANTPAAGRGASWGERGIILYASGDSGLYSAPASGGTAVPVEVSGLKGGAYYNPEFLPRGEDFLFGFVPSDGEGAQVYIATLKGRQAVNPSLLLNNDTTAAFTPAGGGRVLFVRNDNLYCQQLDLKARKLSGGPELVQEHVASYAGVRNAYFSVSRTGTIAWRSGTAVVSQVIVFDRRGNRVGRAGTPAPINTITLSPDESRLIVSGEAGSWIVEADGPGRVALKRRTDESDFRWMRDGSHLISIRGKKLVERSLGSGQLRELTEIPIPKRNYTGLSGISQDGHQILINGQTGLFLYALEGREMQERMVAPPADNSAISPDGKWVVYGLNAEAGIYVQSSSGTGLPRQIADTGSCAVWRADGREILFYDWKNISSVLVEGSGDALKFAAPQPLFSVTPPLGNDSASHPLAVNRDGSRIYFLQSSDQSHSGVIQVRVAAIR